MKYREKKINIIEYKQKKIQGKKPIACTLTPYKEEYGGSSSRWGREKSSAMDWRAAKLVRRRSAETTKKLKKHINKQKSNTAKHQNKNRDEGGEEMRKRDGGTGSRDIK
jgi:hypothetical protein